jgi:elongation factor G
VPKEYVAPIKAGVIEALASGVLVGFPLVDVKVTLTGGSYHDVDSSEIAFKIAGSMAARAAAEKGGPTILEPIMRVEVVSPEEALGDIISDINSRRGSITHMEMESGAQVLTADVPLSEMFGYSTTLRSMSQGRASYTMEPSHYVEVPKSLAQEMVLKMTGRQSAKR